MEDVLGGSEGLNELEREEDWCNLMKKAIDCMFH